MLLNRENEIHCSVAIPVDSFRKAQAVISLFLVHVSGEGSIANAWSKRKVIVVPAVIGALGAVSVNFTKYMYTHYRESEFGSHPENSIAEGSNWTKWSTIQGVIVRIISKSHERGRFEIASTITP